MRPLIALLCSALMTSGCSAVSDLRRDAAGQGRKLGATDAPLKRASLTLSPSQTPQKAPARPASGPGAAAKATPAPDCPAIDPAVYAALAAPTALPPARSLISPEQTKRWIESLEGQVGGLRGHLSETVKTYSTCRGEPKS